ncbi:hypothetical protein AB0H88_52445, partial [Nonomuraea sp. NPDC050680]|uniref:hypothetical protein n=1 Tax=Nonomuraea sp. NPDC050680 TaxID=3154630 RepID=UPI00340469EF
MRGRLRVYLGAAPGVGKTYAMLCEGRRGLERGRARARTPPRRTWTWPTRSSSTRTPATTT